MLIKKIIALSILFCVDRKNEFVYAEDVPYWMHFPQFSKVYSTVDEAVSGGLAPWNMTTFSSCSNGGVGDIYAFPEGNKFYRSHGLYPALFYRNYDSKLAGIIFAVREDLVSKKQDALQGKHPWSHSESGFSGQIYWFQDPATVCSTDVPKELEFGIYMNVTECIPGDESCSPGVKKIPDFIDKGSTGYDFIKSEMGLSFTNQLCLEGMGDHYTYGHCGRAYSYAFMVNADGEVNGVVNAVNLDESGLHEIAKHDGKVENLEGNEGWKYFIGPDADKPEFLLKQLGMNKSYPSTEWGLPESMEAKPFHPLRGLVFDDEILPIGKICGEEGKVGYDNMTSALAPECFLCKPTPRILFHVYRNGLPNLDYNTCPFPHKVTSEGRKKNTVRCGVCSAALNGVAASTAPSKASQCELHKQLFEKSCAIPEYYGEESVYGCNFTPDPSCNEVVVVDEYSSGSMRMISHIVLAILFLLTTNY